MKFKITLLALFLAGCAAPVVVTDFNGDSVTVQGSAAAPDADVAREASRTCGTRNMIAEYASSRQVHAPQYSLPTFAHLYICNPPVKR